MASQDARADGVASRSAAVPSITSAFPTLSLDDPSLRTSEGTSATTDNDRAQWSDRSSLRPAPGGSRPPPSIASQTTTSSTEPSTSDTMSSSHLIVVSNRLPVTISRGKRIAEASATSSDGTGGPQFEYSFKMSSGGLVTALSGLKKRMAFTWIGWPGLNVPLSDRWYVSKRLMDEYNCLPVYLSDEIADRHYNGFSNSILWPLFHYHPGEMCFDDLNWRAYREANLRFAEVVRGVVRKGDMVWCQDYHLMLLPMMLRSLLEAPQAGEAPSKTRREVGRLKKGLAPAPPLAEISGSASPSSHMGLSTVGSNANEGEKEGGGVQDGQDDLRGKRVRIGFFLHTPFPSSEIYRILPVRREILLGLLHCDLIGFHTYDYARHFLSSCTRILGLPTMPNGVEFEGRYAHVGTYPIGIDPSQFDEGVAKPVVQQRIQALQRRFEGVKIIVGVDRLDYIKGVPQKLHGFETFLETHPEWIGKVVLVQVAVPSRQDVEEYQNLRATVNEMVGRINGRFGSVESMPIHFLHRSVNFDELCALYAVSDVCLVTSTRDGMNLVSYEYIACQKERHGTMILSEFAGAAQSLNGSLIINPWDKFAVSDAIHEAVTMPDEQRAVNFSKLHSYVQSHTAAWWGLSFIKDLARIKIGAE